MLSDEPERRGHGGDAGRDPADARPRVASRDLMQGGRRLVIEHNGDEYILQVTRAGRLILTK